MSWKAVGVTALIAAGVVALYHFDMIPGLDGPGINPLKNLKAKAEG